MYFKAMFFCLLVFKPEILFLTLHELHKHQKRLATNLCLYLCMQTFVYLYVSELYPSCIRVTYSRIIMIIMIIIIMTSACHTN